MRSRSDDLELLLAVVDSGGFSAAANRLNIPVAKVSRAIQRLEGELETPLLNRTTRSVALTDEGRGFVERVRELGVETPVVPAGSTGRSAGSGASRSPVFR